MNYILYKRATETVHATEARRLTDVEKAQRRRLLFTRNTWEVFDKAAFE